MRTADINRWFARGWLAAGFVFLYLPIVALVVFSFNDSPVPNAWRGFTLNLRQHKESVRRLAEFDSEILCVGHGDPLPAGAAQQIRAALPTLDK